MEDSCGLDCYATVVEGRLGILVAISMGLAAFAFIRWMWSGFYGSVDQVWGIAPAVYAWLCVLLEPSPRGLLASTLVTLWAFRLSYNFARRGGFHEEDYRWPYMRAWFSSQFGVCCFFFWFTCITLNLIILGFSLPAYVVSTHSTVPFNALDCISASAMLFFIVLEAVADQQQWNYQTGKIKALAAGNATKEQKRGFLAEGLFRYSRHPNLFAEMMIWWSFYGFSVACTGQYLHWSIIGPTVLTGIFIGSTDLTEKISSSKYPLYAVYQTTTSRIVPWTSTPLPKQE